MVSLRPGVPEVGGTGWPSSLKPQVQPTWVHGPKRVYTATMSVVHATRTRSAQCSQCVGVDFVRRCTAADTHLQQRVSVPRRHKPTAEPRRHCTALSSVTQTAARRSPSSTPLGRYLKVKGRFSQCKVRVYKMWSLRLSVTAKSFCRTQLRFTVLSTAVAFDIR